MASSRVPPTYSAVRLIINSLLEGDIQAGLARRHSLGTGPGLQSWPEPPDCRDQQLAKACNLSPSFAGGLPQAPGQGVWQAAPAPVCRCPARLSANTRDTLAMRWMRATSPHSQPAGRLPAPAIVCCHGCRGLPGIGNPSPWSSPHRLRSPPAVLPSHFDGDGVLWSCRHKNPLWQRVDCACGTLEDASGTEDGAYSNQISLASD